MGGQRVLSDNHNPIIAKSLSTPIGQFVRDVEYGEGKEGKRPTRKKR